MLEQRLKAAIRDVPDFPKAGIMFKDITPVLHDQTLCTEILDAFANALKDIQLDALVGIESRGFLFGFALANQLGIPFVLVRKAGKLPYDRIAHQYNLEYGSATVEMHVDEIKSGARVLIHDDLLATGGTAEAAARLVLAQKGIVAGFAFLVALDFLNGKQRLNPYSNTLISLANY